MGFRSRAMSICFVSCPSHLQKQCTLPGFLLNSGVTEAETPWAIQTVLTHSSLRSCDSLSKLFGRIFSDSMISPSPWDEQNAVILSISV